LIVTCESCKSRYKLDDARITGRGAKITCPRCKTVFVVYARDAVAPAPSLPAVDEEDDDGDEPTRRGAAVAMPAPAAHEVSLPAKAAVPVEMAARAAALDFKAVGVNAWKVKVKIGLIYDFSDLKTLRKYITDGRVTTTDVISHDGKNWRVIGDIPDLDAFFVETWETLSAAYKEAPPPPKKSPTVEVEVKKSEPEATRFADPFEEQRKKAESKRRPSGTGAVPVRPKDGKDGKKGEATSNTGKLAAAAVVLLLAGGGWWMTRAPETPPPADSASANAPKVDAGAAQSAAGTATPPAAAAPAVDPTIQKLNAEMAAVQARAPELPQDTEQQVLIPIRRDGGAPTAASGAAATTATGASGAPSMKSSAATAGEFEQAGDAEAKLGNWTTAIAAYRKAVSLDSKSANVHFKLGYSLYRAKDDAAAVSLDAAARLGRTDAYKLLGDIAAEQGDIPGAMSRYQQYLKTKPRDAADIERKMRELSGG
jgi:predicted Zn finger-like uncharacterized protein